MIEQLIKLSRDYDLTYKWKEFWFEEPKTFEEAKNLVIQSGLDYNFNDRELYLTVLIKE